MTQGGQARPSGASGAKEPLWRTDVHVRCLCLLPTFWIRGRGDVRPRSGFRTDCYTLCDWVVCVCSLENVTFTEGFLYLLNYEFAHTA